jgi:hypothetical protein
MARVGRLAGALLVETGGDYWLVGQTKEPCAWAAEGFEIPPEGEPGTRPYVRLQRRGPVVVHEPFLVVEKEGEEVARALAGRMLIERNGSVSERLWRLAIGADDDADSNAPAWASGRWLLEVPDPVWRVVREAVLRCL